MCVLAQVFMSYIEQGDQVKCQVASEQYDYPNLEPNKYTFMTTSIIL